jgi:HAD superfamily hydrolase (TIGR01509 family)
MKTIIFDYDGVLVDTFDFHLRKVNEIYDIDLSAQEFKDVHNGNFFDTKLDKFEGIDFSKYAEIVSTEQSKLPLNKRANELLHELTGNYTLHLITSAWKAQVLPSLQSHNIFDLFTSCQYADNGKSKHDKLKGLLQEQNALPAECIFITDTLGDLLEAHQLNIPTIAVTFGFHDKNHLLTGQPAYITDSFQNIKQILQEKWDPRE